MSRQKTRKWVEAKTQNYDGDDWGAEDEFDDYDNNDNGPELHVPPQRPGRLTAGLRAVSASGVSTPLSASSGSATSLRPSERIAFEKQQAALQRSATGPPALHIHTPPRTQTSPIPQIAAQSHFPPRKSSIASKERPDLSDQPTRTGSRPESPTGGVGSPNSATGPSIIIRPADIYKRMGKEKEKERRSSESARRPSLDSVGRNDGEGEPATQPMRRPSFGVNDGGDGSRGLRPLDTVAERKSEYGFDGLTVNAGGTPPPASSNNIGPDTARGSQLGSEPTISSQPVLQHPQARKELYTGAEPTKRYSTSPKLPLLSRISGFGGDLFGSSNLGLLTESGKQTNPPAESSPEQPQPSSSVAGSVTEPPALKAPTPPTASAQRTPSPSNRDLEVQPSASEQVVSEPSQAKPTRPSLPGGWVTETTTPGEMATPGSEQAVNNHNLSTIDQHPGDVPNGLAPLRTPSPGDRSAGHVGDDGQYNTSGRASPTNLAAGEPSVVPEEARDATAEKHSHDEHERKPTSDVDALGIAPLQPRKGSAPDSSPEDFRPPIMRVETYSTLENSSPLKESDFLRDEIMRSLSPARPADGSKELPQDEDVVRESAYLSDVYGDYWSGDDKLEAAATSKQEKRNAGDPEPTSTTKEESVITPAQPGYSWASEAPIAAPAAEPETANPGLNRNRFSWEAGREASESAQSPESPKEVTSSTLPAEIQELISPLDADLTSPLITLPTLNIDDNGSNSRGVGQRYSLAEPLPLSSAGDRDSLAMAPGDRRSSLFSYHTDDKMLMQSPMSPMSPMEPIGLEDNEQQAQDQQAARASTPSEATAPEGVPLPRSPSPTKPRSQPAAYNSMTLKQIQQLPTSDDRVLKMRETREHFAELDSGLSEWLADMSSREQHENAMATFNYALSGADAELWGTKGGARIPLNAAPASAEEGAGQGAGAGGGGQSQGGPNGNVGFVGRSASGSVNLGNLVMHSGQAGAKGKELLHSAGKLSKGLLSKGKNKLRERAESKKG